MLRPERMSKVSVTGSKKVMDDVVETVHGLNLLHVTEYDGSWDGFQRGDPTAGAESASEKLVTIRSIESILDVDAEDAGPTRVVSDEALEEDLAEVRARVNELDDRRNEVEDELRDVEERIESMEPFVDLGIDLDLLSGYDSIEIAVGTGKRDRIEEALASSSGIRNYRVFTSDSGSTLGIFARPHEGSTLSDALVGTEFAAVGIPDVSDIPDDVRGTDGAVAPETYVQELQSRRRKLRSRLETVEGELEEVKLDAAGFLLAAEEKLSIEVQKTEAPLTFATTKNAFVAEGWIPTARYGDFVADLTEAVGDHVEIQRLEDAEFNRHGGEEVREQYTGGGTPAATDGGDAARADGGDEETARADGGNVVMQNDSPPVIQDNPNVVKPFEVLVQAVGRPKYTEFDPTVLVFLTFPAFFGFMIGDLGYGIIYTAIGYFLYSKFESPAFRSMGGVTIAAGLFTMLFGILYGEIFGLHTIASVFWEGVVGLSHAPIEKGLSPATAEWALAWLFVSVLIGIVHLNMGWILDFIETLEFHGFKHALYESGSWLLMVNGLWIWIFSDVVRGTAPEFIYTTFSSEGVIALGFSGFPVVVGWAGLAVFVVGLVLLIIGEPVEAVEFLNVLVNVLSYTRIAAVLLAKAGMAFTVNLLFFGVYVDSEGGWHFGVDGMPTIPAGTDSVMYHGYEVTEVMFGGLVHGGLAFVLVGLLVLVIGHALVLALGVTSAGLQAVRLEYVEFFNKFFDGGGTAYDPFGYERQYTADD
ncbi:V-type ATP synthase subunit I [Salinigranum salinum]|uniref:V-type ATP synthase subunit I n=1 Tax=Salinigranum salinum TaxID=1364937 RepID=UPI001260DF76|nr:V-type ATP synthase subunit I [Salinigranum salinum]